MTALDGNAIAGTLASAFGKELTTATSSCERCGRRNLVAELAVYLRAPGTVARCRHCGAVVMVMVEARGVTCVDLQGLSALDAAG